MKPPNITRARVLELLTYDPETGVFRNRVFRSSVAKIGDIAGCRHNMGYWKIRIDRHYILAHRLAWFYVHGTWPKEIDHINGDRGDSRLANLRIATHSQNMANKKCYAPNLTGFRGVHKKLNRFVAYISVNNKRVHLGSFKTPEDAHAAYLAALPRYHGEFAAPTDWRKAA